MTKQVVPPDVVGEALALREAGYTTLAIGQRLGLSIRTLQRHFASAGTRKGAIGAEVLRKPKTNLWPVLRLTRPSRTRRLAW